MCIQEIASFRMILFSEEPGVRESNCWVLQSDDFISSVGRGSKCKEDKPKKDLVPLPIKEEVEGRAIGADMVMPPAPIKGGLCVKFLCKASCHSYF